MSQSLIVGMLYNAALLMALGIVFDSITLRNFKNILMAKVVTGLLLSAIALAIMLNPFVLKPGVVFDTRSILLSLTGLFFGIIPTLIVTAVSLTFRITQGGAGVYMGCSVIVTSVLWGMYWKHLHKKWDKPYKFSELYLLGLVNHITMLACTLFLPAKIRGNIFNSIALPVILIYPLGTVFLGMLLGRRIQRRLEKHDLEERERQFRNLFDNAPLPYQSLDINGNFVAVNNTWLNTMGYSSEEVIGKNFSEFMDVSSKEKFKKCFPKFKADGHIEDVEHIMLKKDGKQIIVSFNGKIVYHEDGSFLQTQCVFTDITERKKQEAALKSIEWMLSKQDIELDSSQSYGDLTELNKDGIILNSIGKDVLQELVADYLSLLDTSSAVYEKNGDYAMGIFSSGWCKFMDDASRKLCNTNDNQEALESGKWLCHESCWTDVSKKAIESGEVVDLECYGCLHLYAVPIKTSNGIIGAINMGYGNPPQDDKSLKKLAELYQVDIVELKQKAFEYQNRPLYIIEQAKSKLHTAARIIGEIVERKHAEMELKRVSVRQQAILSSVPDIIMQVDNNKIYTWANKAGIDFYGEDVIGKSASYYFVREQKTFDLVQPLFYGDENVIYVESWQKRKDSLERLLAWWCKVLRDENGNVVGALSTARDITEQREAEEELNNYFTNALDLFCIADTDGYFRRLNKSWETTLGYDLQELENVRFLDFVHEEDLSATIKAISLLSEQKEVLNFINRYRSKDGSYRWIEWKSYPSGNRIYAAARDITELLESQKAIQESEEKYRSLVESSDSVIAMFDKEGRIVFANKVAGITLGINERELLGKQMTDIFPPDIAKLQSELIEEVFASAKSKSAETRSKILGKDIWYHTSICPVLDVDKKPYMVVVNATDITQIKSAEQAIVETNAKFEKFMDNLPGGAFIKDKEFKTVYVNKFMEEAFAAQNWMGKTPTDVFDKALAESMIADDKTALETGFQCHEEIVPHKDGKIHYYETTKFKMPDVMGDVLLGGMAFDITNRKIAEIERNLYAKRLEILHDIDTGILEARTLGQICQSSLNYLHQLLPSYRCSIVVWGETKNEWLLHILEEGEYKTKVLDFNPVDFTDDLGAGMPLYIPDARNYAGHFSEYRQNLVKQGIISHLHVPLIMKGEFFGTINFGDKVSTSYSEDILDTLKDIANQMTIAIQQMHLTREISHYADELELKVAERTAQLKNANKEMEAFSYTVAHDLRSPLRSIDGFANMLLEDYSDKLDEDGKHKLDVIKSNAIRMDTLIKELLDLAKLNPYALKPRAINMNDVVIDVLNQTIAADTREQFEFVIEELPNAYADLTLIEQVWQNLIANAVKFTLPKEEKKITIGSFVKDKDSVYYIKDSGVGFDMKYIDKIFGPFQRLHKTTEFEGTGIGLAIVHKIIQRHNGCIWVESEVGQGTIFYFSLPEQEEKNPNNQL